LEAGGFLGIDQFGGPHAAAQEIVYLLGKVKRNGGKVIFVPGALAIHHTALPTLQRMLSRAFWQGVSASIIRYLLYGRFWSTTWRRILGDGTALIFFLFCCILSCLKLNKPAAMYHGMRASRRLGLVLGELRLVGDWRSVRVWTLTHNLQQ
jgi:hypothetical protein